MVICEALQITPEELLVGSVDDTESDHNLTDSGEEIELQIMRRCQKLSDVHKKRLLAYVSMLQNMKE